MNKLVLVYKLILISYIFSFDTASDSYLNSINVDNRLGNTLSEDIQITTDSGEIMSLKNYFSDGLPVVLTLAYYECPMLCTLVLNSLSKNLSEINLIPGKDYKALTLSIDPDEGIDLASKKKNNYMTEYFINNPNKDFWTFSVANKKNIDKISSELGFNYSYDPNIDQYAHSAVVYVLTEDRVISRQIFGISPTSNDMKLAILSASEKSISSIFDKILLYCYQYNPKTGGYSIIASNAMKVAGAISVLVIFVFISSLWVREKVV